MTNVYRIGVQIAMASNGPQLLGVLARHLGGINAQTKQLTGGFNTLKLAIGGAVAVGAGFALIGMFKGPLEEAKKFEMSVGRFARFGLGPERTREAAEFAKAMNIAGSTYTDNMRRMAEAQGVFRESGLKGEEALRGAKLAAPILAKIDFANAGLDEESRAKMNTQALAMLRFIEMRGGVNSPQKFAEIADAGFKAITSSGGSMNWEQLRQFMARSGASASSLSNEALFAKLEPVITEMKGSTAGFGMRTAFGRLNGIVRLPNQVAHELVDAGIWDPSKITWNSMGGIRAFKGNPLRNADLFATDPVAFYEQKIKPMWDAKGLTVAQRARENAMIFGNGPAGLMFSLIDRQLPAINRSVGAQRAAMGIEQAYGVAGGTLNGKIIDMHAKFVNLMERLGEAVLPLAVKGLTVLVPAISKLTEWVSKHPGEVAFFAKAAVIVGGALIALGAAAIGIAAGAVILAAGPVGVVVAGVAAVVGALIPLVAMNFSAIANGFRMIYDTLAFMVAHPIKFLTTPVDQLPGLIHKSGAGIGGGNHILNPEILAHLAMGDLAGAAAIAGARGGARSAVPPPHKAANSNGPGTVFLDAKKVGRIISDQQASALGGGRAAAGRYDPATGLPSAMQGYYR